MPQLSKGGKYVFGWSRVREDGGIRIPDEVMREYHLKPGEKAMLMSGSKTSGGFSVAKKSSLEQSVLSKILEANPKLASYRIEEGKTTKFRGRHYCWARIHDNGLIVIPPHTLETYGVKPRHRLLSIRGSNIAFALVARGPIVETAKRHPEIKVFE
jgi:bifunctional DNA-binding transcriptional regulator/antitoxin component of YhaV-PrlF toxin-antitoxin module